MGCKNEFSLVLKFFSPSQTQENNEITPYGSEAENKEPPKVAHKKHESHDSKHDSSTSSKKKKHRDRDRDREHSSSRSSVSSKKLEFPKEKLVEITKEHNHLRKKMGDGPESNNSWFIGAFSYVTFSLPLSHLEIHEGCSSMNGTESRNSLHL